MATDLKPPTNPAGYVDTTAAWAANSSWASILYDFSETIGDVMWPTSVWTYSQMRRDPRLTAILNAYTLPIRRASWSLDPAGCQDEVVRLVADDLGLPVKGDDKPGAARTRGVSWPAHLRMSLLDLVYGHMGFEMGAEIDAEGRARLVLLSERMPQTISQIHVDRQGLFNGISQWSLPGDPKSPDIPAEHMVWYAHEREGAQWQGHSLLRSSYAPWLLKREMQRVHATGNRRFNHGIPVVRWAAGSTPTASQHQAAEQIAANMRGGDQAGAALPPGAFVEIVGLSGGVPDTKGFLDWLNGEMSTATLTHFLDLVTSTHGSRALGQAFIDYFLLAIQAVAEEHADYATRQTSARIVEWNWGPDEPVPAICVADVGSQHEVTAEALQQLMANGAVQADPALEAYVRGLWSLPARSIPWTPPRPPGPQPQQFGQGDGGGDQGGGDNPPPPQPAPAYAAADPKDGARVEAAPGPRDLTPTEQAAGVDFGAQQQAHQDAVDQVREQWPDAVQPLVDVLVALAVAAVAGGSLGALGSLSAPADVVANLADLIATQMADLAGQTAASTVAEAASQGVHIPVPDDPGVEHLHEVATAIGQRIAIGYSTAAGSAALHAGAGGDVETAVRDTLDAITDADRGLVNDQLGAAMHAAQRTGRVSVYRTGPPARYAASEQMDANTCEPCQVIDGHEFDTLEEAEAAYPTGGYVDCLGGLRCRGIIVAVWDEEAALHQALTELAGPVAAAFDPGKHARNPKGSPGGGRFRSMVDRLKDAITAHQHGGGEGHPFDGFNREQLRRVARKQGIDLKHGEDRDSIAQKLLDHVRGGQPDSTPKAPAAHQRVTGQDLQQRYGYQGLVDRINAGAAKIPPLSVADEGLSAIAKMQGFDGKPRVVGKAELDRLITDEGHHEFFRGVSVAGGSMTAAEINEMLRSGGAYFGVGIYGNGYYFGGHNVAEAYAEGQEGGIIRGALPPDAKVIKYQDIGTGSMSDPALRDPGRWAMARGYDAIRIPRGKADGSQDYYVILNRTALVAEEAA